MTNRRLRVGVIGPGGIGQVHLTEYQKNKKCKLVSVASGTKEHAIEAAKKYKIENSYWEEDWKIMIQEDNLDIVSICSPNYLHAPMTIEALDNNINLLCEKPICITRDELIKIENKIVNTDLIYFTSFQKRYVPIFIYLKDILEEKLLGEINLIRHIYSHKGPYTSWKPLSKEKWFFDAQEAGGGVLLDLGVHCIDILRMLNGEYSNIIGYTQNTTCKGITHEDNCSVLFRFENDAIGIISVSWCNELMEMIDISGTKGTIRFSLQDKNPVKVMPRKLKRNKFIKKALNYRPSGDIAQHSLIDHFIDCVVRREQEHPNFFDGKRAVEFVLDSYDFQKA